MRVLLDVSAVPSDPRGAGRYISELARHLVRLDDPDLDLVLLSRRGDGGRWHSLGAAEDRVPPTVDPAVPGPRPSRLVWEQVAGPRHAARVGAEVWHGPHYTVPLRLRIPSVVTVHDLTLLEHPEWHERPKALYFGRMIPAAIARAAVCVCVSRHTAARLAAVLPERVRRSGTEPVGRSGTEPVGRSGTEPEIVVIPHGVDHARFHPEADDSCDVARLDALGVRAPYVAFLGTIEPRKDVASLVGAFARLASAQPDLRLVVAGGRGWDDDAVRTAIERSGVAHRIVRTGYLPDDTVPALLRRASVVVYPSLEEGFGLPALEALACGAPLVSTTGSSIEEFVGDAGLLVPPGDPDALAGALERALDPTVAADLARRGPVQVAGYTWEAAAAAHVDAYRHARARRS